MPGETSDADVEACQRGDRDAFRSLFLRYQQPVFRLAYRYTGNPDDAEDLTQEVFIRVFQRIGSFRFESSFSTWLYRIAANTSLNFCRDRRPVESLEDLAQTNDPALALAPPEIVDDGVIQAAVAALPENLRVVFLLVTGEDLTYGEVAEALEITVEAVRMRMCRARRSLRQSLSACFNSLPGEGE